MDRLAASLQVALQLRSAASYHVGTPKRPHALRAGTFRRDQRLGDGPLTGGLTDGMGADDIKLTERT